MNGRERREEGWREGEDEEMAEKGRSLGRGRDQAGAWVFYEVKSVV
jgi:hypothetical protein